MINDIIKNNENLINSMIKRSNEIYLENKEKYSICYKEDPITGSSINDFTFYFQEKFVVGIDANAVLELHEYFDHADDCFANYTFSLTELNRIRFDTTIIIGSSEYIIGATLTNEQINLINGELLQDIYFYNIYAPFISFLFQKIQSNYADRYSNERCVSLFELFKTLKDSSILSFRLIDDKPENLLLINDPLHPLKELYIDSNVSVNGFLDYINHKWEFKLTL